MLVKIIEPDFNFEDPRGRIVQLVHSGYKQVNVVTSKKGAVRGGFHYHEKNEEAFYIVKGKVQVELKLNDSSETHIFGEGSMFCVGKNIRHKFVFLEDTILIGLYDKGIEAEDGRKDILED